MLIGNYASDNNKQTSSLRIYCYWKYLLFCSEMLNTKIFIPYKYVFIWGYNIWMKKTLRIPPVAKVNKNKDLKAKNVKEIA